MMLDWSRSLKALTWTEFLAGIAENPIGSTLPTEIGLLSNLLFAYFQSCQLSGALPSEISRLTHLEELSISQNQVTMLPTELGLLTSLFMLELASNDIEGKLPDLTGLVRLESLVLSGNSLQGTFPQHLVKLSRLVSWQKPTKLSNPCYSLLVVSKEFPSTFFWRPFSIYFWISLQGVYQMASTTCAS